MARAPRKTKSKGLRTVKSAAKKAATKKAAVKSSRAKKTTPKKTTKPRAKTAAERMAARRARLRAQGLKPVTFWLPDVNNPKVQADLRRQGRLMAKHNEGGAVDDWIMNIYDPDA